MVSKPNSPSSSSSSSSFSLPSFLKLKSLIHSLFFTHVARSLSKAKSFLYKTLFFKQHNQKNKLILGSFRLHYNWCSHSHPIDCRSTWNSVFDSHIEYAANSAVSEKLLEEELLGDIQFSVLESRIRNLEDCAVNQKLLEEDFPIKIQYSDFESHIGNQGDGALVMEEEEFSSCRSFSGMESHIEDGRKCGGNGKVLKEEEMGLSGYLQWLEEKGCSREQYVMSEIDKLADMFIASCHEKFRLEKIESYRRYQEMLARSI